jgi:hypothetical protein
MPTLTTNIPDGYITGVLREHPIKIAHLYRGTFQEPGLPMCQRGWNRREYGYSIWRNLPYIPICKVCLRRAREGKDGVENKHWKNSPKVCTE